MWDKESYSSTESIATTRIQCWKDVARGKCRGRVYGIRDLATNIHHGMSFLTQPSTLSCATLPTQEQLHEIERL